MAYNYFINTVMVSIMRHSKIYVVYGYDLFEQDYINVIAFPKRCDAESFVNSMNSNDKRVLDQYDFEEIDFINTTRD